MICNTSFDGINLPIHENHHWPTKINQTWQNKPYSSNPLNLTPLFFFWISPGIICQEQTKGFFPLKKVWVHLQWILGTASSKHELFHLQIFWWTTHKFDGNGKPPQVWWLKNQQAWWGLSMAMIFLVYRWVTEIPPANINPAKGHLRFAYWAHQSHLQSQKNRPWTKSWEAIHPSERYGGTQPSSLLSYWIFLFI